MTKNIYIVFTFSGTILSKIIKKYTKGEYSHVSISLNEDLTELYSFGRKRAYNPFYAGFIKEEIDVGTFKRFKNTKTAVYSMSIEVEQYKKIKEIIKMMKEKEEIYHFNFLGLIFVAINLKKARENKFYCAEFVKYVLESANISVSQLPDLIKPEDFKKLELHLIYKGYLRDYKYANKEKLNI